MRAHNENDMGLLFVGREHHIGGKKEQGCECETAKANFHG